MLFTRRVGRFVFSFFLHVSIFLLFLLQRKQDTWTINGDETGVTQRSEPLETKPDSLKYVREKKTCLFDTGK